MNALFQDCYFKEVREMTAVIMTCPVQDWLHLHGL